MKRKQVYALAFVTILLQWSCAKFVPPTGGDKDITPPKVIKTTPVNKERNYQATEIYIEFDELVDTKNIKRDLIITPEPESKYKIKDKGNVVILNFEEPLDTNTTYTFSFGNGIKDLNEGNPVKDLKIVFSTGNQLDSLGFGGNIKNIFTKKEIYNTTISLFNIDKPDTINLLERKPTYFVKTDSSGNYKFENLKGGNYRLVAFQDINNNRKLDNKKELFAYEEDTLRLGDESIKNINLELFPYDTIPPKFKRYSQTSKTFTLFFDEPLYKYQVKYAHPVDSMIYANNEDQFTFYKNEMIKDSVMVKMWVADSLLNESEIEQVIKFSTAEEQRGTKKINQPLKLKLEPKPNGKLYPNQEIKLQFEKPVLEIDTTKIKVKQDSTTEISSYLTFTNPEKTSAVLKFEQPKTKLVFITAEDKAIYDIVGDSSSAFETKYQILTMEDTGIIAGKIESKTDSVNYIINLIQEEGFKTVRTIQTGENQKTYEFKYVEPESYYIQVIEDKNKNGIWDTGNFYQNTKPEKVFLLPKPIKVKANFEFRGVDITTETP